MISWVKFSQKGCFWSQTEKVNITTEFCVFELVYVPNFSLNWQIWFFGPNLPKKGISGQKRKKWTSPHWILQIRIILCTEFQFKWQFCFLFLFFFDQIWPKRVFPAEKGKIVLVRGSMVVTYYITIFRTGANRHNGSLMSLLLLVAGTIYSNNENNKKSIKSYNVNEVFTETWFVMPKRKCCVTPS